MNPRHFSMRRRISVSFLTIIFLTLAELRAQDTGPDWVKVTAEAGWRARDSSGELVYKDQLWIFGGWFDSFQTPPRDVWSSKDGQTWKLVEKEAPWKYSDLPMTLTFQDKMWFHGASSVTFFQVLPSGEFHASRGGA